MQSALTTLLLLLVGNVWETDVDGFRYQLLKTTLLISLNLGRGLSGLPLLRNCLHRWRLFSHLVGLPMALNAGTDNQSNEALS